jgi:ABC-type Fe3+ transport system permease subunit
MLAGICLKLVLMLLWAALFFDFARAYLTDKPVTATEQTTAERKGAITRPIKVILFCLFVTYLAFFVRIVYRFLELTGGWEGKFHSTEIYFSMYIP